MIPQFPNFKKLELSDREEIEKFTSRFDPYSDFCFINLWSWDFHDSARVSLLNDNLVLTIVDHATLKPLYTYLGNNEVNDTLNRLFEFFDDQEIGGKLSLVPEISLTGIDFSKYYIGIDINSCDYVYDLNDLSTLAGNKYTHKRGRTNNFKAKHPDAQIVILDVQEHKTKQEIINLNNLWVHNKIEDEKYFEYELNSLTRFMASDFNNIFAIGIYDTDLIGYAIFSLCQNGYVINHYIKADVQHRGVYEHLMQQSAKHLTEKGYKWLNHQEDMGIEGLRTAKMAYRPINFLRKYSIHKL